MVKPEQFSIIGMYGDKKIFEMMMAEGYTQVASGTGQWIVENGFEYRIVRLFAFACGTDDSVATYEHPKMNDGITNRHGQPYESRYQPQEWDKHCNRFKITLGEKRDLSDLLKSWDE